jgi:methionine synthase I (cobalamin-dependent)
MSWSTYDEAVTGLAEGGADLILSKRSSIPSTRRPRCSRSCSYFDRVGQAVAADRVRHDHHAGRTLSADTRSVLNAVRHVRPLAVGPTARSAALMRPYIEEIARRRYVRPAVHAGLPNPMADTGYDKHAVTPNANDTRAANMAAMLVATHALRATRCRGKNAPAAEST